MEKIIIYDNEGFIYTNLVEGIKEPVGIPWMKVDIPNGQYVKCIDVSTDEHTPVFADLYTPSEDRVNALEEELEMMRETQAIQNEVLEELLLTLN